jgi:hypothetical protein
MGKVFIGDPFQADKEVSDAIRVKTEYLDLIRLAESGLDAI